jgi:hypothetical protein
LEVGKLEVGYYSGLTWPKTQGRVG